MKGAGLVALYRAFWLWLVHEQEKKYVPKDRRGRRD